MKQNFHGFNFSKSLKERSDCLCQYPSNNHSIFTSLKTVFHQKFSTKGSVHLYDNIMNLIFFSPKARKRLCHESVQAWSSQPSFSSSWPQCSPMQTGRSTWNCLITTQLFPSSGPRDKMSNLNWIQNRRNSQQKMKIH